MRKTTVFLSALALAAAALAAQSPAAKALQIYVIDVEGGNAQLWVLPSGESVVVDTGNGPGAAAVRDADRIMAEASRDTT
jgi:glyoxylase-like metal-dependent hydrolase (beta-lactamase superfamily II)